MVPLTRGAWRVLLYIIFCFGHALRPYTRACVLDNALVSRSVYHERGRCLGWMPTSWHQCNRATSYLFPPWSLSLCDFMLVRPAPLASVSPLRSPLVPPSQLLNDSSCYGSLGPPPPSTMVFRTRLPSAYEICAAVIGLTSWSPLVLQSQFP